ncbi:hypothetical protein [Nonomuraea angiospora]|uniref:hypothetical protein n=1 Tax=Nonomuraea angiospora TaxID=46172 RepID=UPI0029A885F4|nr:hypothetical protein [Nonomuraea angiospora]MDX3103514.1 hypothetical protein [Nonomuraea angiospora]
MGIVHDQLLDGAVALVTGASSGIGAATACRRQVADLVNVSSTAGRVARPGAASTA